MERAPQEYGIEPDLFKGNGNDAPGTGSVYRIYVFAGYIGITVRYPVLGLLKIRLCERTERGSVPGMVPFLEDFLENTDFFVFLYAGPVSFSCRGKTFHTKARIRGGIMSNFNRKNILNGFFWRFAERCGAQGVLSVVSVILARLLAPEAYGTIALITVFTGILQIFVDGGMGNALIQKKDADDLDFSSVFYFNVAVCLLLYAAMFFAAPFIASFYRDPGLIPLIRVLSLTLIISGIKNVQQAYVSRTMQFRRFFAATLAGTAGAAVLGVSMALMGFGVWALVAQQVLNITVDTIVLWMTVKWRPKWMFSVERLKGMLGYGWKLLVSGLLDRVYNELRQLIIGKMYSPSDLAYYNQGEQYPRFLVANINTSIDSVLFPAMSDRQGSPSEVRGMMRRSIKTSAYIMAPLMTGTIAASVPLIRLLLTERWLSCAPFLQVFCVTYMFYPIHTANLNAIKAMGRSDLFLKLELLKKAIGMAALLLSVRFGVLAMAYSLLAASVAGQFINSWPNRTLLNYSYFDQIKDIMPAVSLAVGMGICISLVPRLALPDAVTLLLMAALGGILYIGGSWLFKLDAFEYILNILKPAVRKRGQRK